MVEHLDIVSTCKSITAGLNCRKGPVHCCYIHNHLSNSNVTSRNTTSVPAFNVESFPHRHIPQGAVVGQTQISAPNHSSDVTSTTTTNVHTDGRNHDNETVDKNNIQSLKQSNVLRKIQKWT